MNEEIKTPKTFFEEKIKPILLYVGSIGATLMVLAYIALVSVLIFGFQAKNPSQVLIFAIINAIFGLIIFTMLKIQGETFAKKLPQNEEILTQYYNTKTHDKKLHSMKYFWIKSTITDICSKGFSILFSTAAVVYIIIEGSDDYTLYLMAFVNILMFICFGLLAMVKAYDFFNNQHIPYIKEQIRLIEEEKEKLELKEENDDSTNNEQSQPEYNDNSGWEGESKPGC